MVRHRAIEPKSTEPAVGQVQVNFLAQPPLRADARAVADEKHADHQLRGDRRPALLAIERAQVLADVGQVHKSIDGTQQMVRRNVPFERKLVEQGFLLDPTFPHHRLHPRSPTTGVNQSPRARAIPSFSTQSPRYRPFEQDPHHRTWALAYRASADRAT